MRAPIRLESRAPRPNWKERVESAGLTWHTAEGLPYWTEDRSLVLTLKAAETLEDAATELQAMCLEACEEIVKRGWWDRLCLPETAARMAEASWITSELSIYGRFDFAWNGVGTPKLLEYNADTPTSLLEASVIQWQWLEDVASENDQLNSIHEALVDRWKLVPDPMIHFACVWDQQEDRQTIAYLAETAEQAGKTVELLDMTDIGLSPEGRFTDHLERPIDRLFKLNPGHPLLLPSFFKKEELSSRDINLWVEKTLFGREGAGVEIVERGRVLRSGQPAHFPTDPVIYQQHASLFQAEGQHVVWGLWMVGDECRGLSARADNSPITGNLSRFLPHRIEG